jgi:ferrous iron transport protein B
VPQIGLLFLLLGFLEESGYMARAALLLDRLMRSVGLSGRAFIPLMSSFACAVPGIMAARTLDSRRDRLVTMLIAPFMGCSARLPVYTLVVAATFAHLPPVYGVLSVGGLVIFAMYLLGFVAALGTAWLLKRTALPETYPTLLMELPAYRMPQLGCLGRHVLQRCLRFVKGTGGTIVTLSVLLWALLTFPQVPVPSDAALGAYGAQRGLGTLTDETAPRMIRAYRLEHSVAGAVGRAIEPVIEPLGFDWRIGVGLMASFAAREVLVSTLAQVYALDADSPDLMAALRDDEDPQSHRKRFTALTGLSLMVFFVLAMQCMSTLAILRKETGGWTWPLVALGYMNGLAYGASFVIYQGGRLLGYA